MLGAAGLKSEEMGARYVSRDDAGRKGVIGASLSMVSLLGELVWGRSSQLSDCHVQIEYCCLDTCSSATKWHYLINIIILGNFY